MASGTLDFRTIAFKLIGPGVALLVLIVCGFIGGYNPSVGVVFGAIGLAACALLGLLDISITAIAGIVLVAMILAIRYGVRREGA
jgi:hypothetical protein